MKNISELECFIHSEGYMEILEDRLVFKEKIDDMDDRVIALENELAQTRAELKSAVRLIAALAEGKQLTVIRHAGGTTINVTDPRLDEDKPVWTKPSLRIVR